MLGASLEAANGYCSSERSINNNKHENRFYCDQVEHRAAVLLVV